MKDRSVENGINCAGQRYEVRPVLADGGGGVTSVEQMLKNVKVAEGLTLAQVKRLVLNANVDTDFATLQAAEIENTFLTSESRDVRIAVFLAGLMANLVEAA